MNSNFFEAPEFYFGANFGFSFFFGYNDFLFKGNQYFERKKKNQN